MRYWYYLQHEGRIGGTTYCRKVTTGAGNRNACQKSTWKLFLFIRYLNFIECNWYLLDARGNLLQLIVRKWLLIQHLNIYIKMYNNNLILNPNKVGKRTATLSRQQREKCPHVNTFVLVDNALQPYDEYKREMIHFLT